MNIEPFPQGLNQEEVMSYAGECMEEDDRLYTWGDVHAVAGSVVEQCLKICAGNPDLCEKVRQHFALK